MRTPVFLIGYRCTGKTTTGKLLAQLLNRPFLDTDRVLEQTLGTRIRGWGYFRKLETRTLESLDLAHAPVISTGGGIVLETENCSYIRDNGIAVWLKADTQTIVERLGADPATSASRPNLTDSDIEAETRSVLKLRTPLYDGIAAFSVNTADHTPDAAAQFIMEQLDKDTYA